MNGKIPILAKYHRSEKSIKKKAPRRCPKGRMSYAIEAGWRNFYRIDYLMCKFIPLIKFDCFISFFPKKAVSISDSFLKYRFNVSI